MKTAKQKRGGALLWGAAVLVFLAAPYLLYLIPRPGPSAEPAAPAPDPAIAFLEARIAADPKDGLALLKLAGIHLRRLGETGDHAALAAAEELTARARAACRGRQHKGVLGLRIRLAHYQHDFTEAARLARALIALDPRKRSPHLMLGDALFENGDYDEAAGVYQAIEADMPGGAGASVDIETRLARLARVRGRLDEARARFDEAIAAARELPPGKEAALAWCLRQRAELAIETGDHRAAEAWLREAFALKILKEAAPILLDLARTRAALDDRPRALRLLTRAIDLKPSVDALALRADLLELTGQRQDAARDRARIVDVAYEREAGHAHPEGVIHGHPDRRWPGHEARALARFYADHELAAEDAYQIARREYQGRRDISTADAFAWAAFKAGHLDEARDAIAAVNKSGAQVPDILYHAGLIAAAAGEKDAARQALKRALELSPRFHPIHAELARKALAALEG